VVFPVFGRRFCAGWWRYRKVFVVQESFPVVLVVWRALVTSFPGVPALYLVVVLCWLVEVSEG
jgi:hypothetical protein